MSAILAIVANDAAAVSPPVVRDMLRAMAPCGSDRVEQWQEDGVVLAVQRATWEMDDDFSGPALLVHGHEVVVAADARLYYLNELRRRLAIRGVTPGGPTASHCIVAAYEAFGDDCAELLEGDFAFVLWDRRQRKLVASRDFSGTRSLYRATLGSGVAYASVVSALRGHPHCAADLDLATIASDAAGLLYSAGNGTVYRAIRQVEAGSTELWQRQALTCHRWFTLPEREGAPRPAAEAEAQLGTLLEAAVRERMAQRTPTAVWMSGGYDSTAVAAMLHQAAQKASLQPARTYRVVSVSYPEGNSGREDELIVLVAQHLGVPVHWLDGSALGPIPPAPRFDAAGREESHVHLHAAALELLAHGTRAVESRVALHGHAGDFLFQCAPWFLSDLLRRGRLSAVWREWRAFGIHTQPATWFWKYAVEPALPPAVLRGLGRLRGRRFMGLFERLVPPWLRTPTTATLALDTRAPEWVPDVQRHGAAHAEFRWYFENQGFPRLAAVMHGAVHALGVEARSPFHDLRVVRFMAQGHHSERYADGDTKLLLRGAMRPFLPPALLARRAERTGTLGTRLEQSAAGAAAWLRQCGTDLRLADLGLLDRSSLTLHIAQAEAGRATPGLCEALLRTAQVEWFLRRDSRSARGVMTEPVSAGSQVAGVLIGHSHAHCEGALS
ncbi:asparagine synthetase B family protein [Gemmatimonas sp.]|uniref:asparagine synthase-related protein n=1 Tax=Gemmatimonas sp. TaxID=1962908 RepID=UPI0022CCD294|nr:asparagine synthetase B family protein [Gemmatimonas sp.]MCZ8204300.1 asparagine synthetase B family protein [Gemmatimonas sp.]